MQEAASDLLAQELLLLCCGKTNAAVLLPSVHGSGAIWLLSEPILRPFSLSIQRHDVCAECRC